MFFRSTFACGTHDREAFPVINRGLAMMGPLSQPPTNKQRPPCKPASSFFVCQREISFHRHECFQTSVHANQGLARALAFSLSRGQSGNLGTEWAGQMGEVRCVLIWQKDSCSFPPAAEVSLMHLCGRGQVNYLLWDPGVCSECEG